MDFSRKLPIGVQSFKVIRNDNFLYADKTELVYKLASSGRVYFLSRPRRFGKSLLLSTLEAYFLGQKELFKGLAIEKLEEAEKEKREIWQEYPVFHLDFNVGKYSGIEDLNERINFLLKNIEKQYGIMHENTAAFGLRFEAAIKTAYEKTGKQVVVLVDEYDKPLLQTMSVNEKLNEEYRAVLKAFYSVLKSSDQYIRFAFLTGVTKFSKVSIFSDLNNLRDISMEEDFGCICGITQEELEKTFQPEIKILQEREACSYEDILLMLKQRYDGYLFNQNSINVYNPFSLLNAFAKKELGNYWFETGTPTFLVNYLKNYSYNIPDLDGNVEMDASGLSDYRAESGSVIPILFQAGYLTIKSYDKLVRLYKLGFPNDEVRYGFLYNLFPSYCNVVYAEGPFCIAQFYRDIIAGRVEDFMQRLKSIMASLPYSNVKKDSNENLALREYNYQICIYLVFALMGQFVEVEIPSSKGRTDCVVKTGTAIYIFEFKLKEDAKTALNQIKEKNYAERFKADNKQIVLIGVSFDPEEKTVGEWIKEEI
ncbi:MULTISPECIES: ATP-binding protein [unclassified Treponema]|uniref:ATP-binding protein n=1 Tax=unclassified Treponema TaxID=2638727 RepID=UPI0020A4BE78|nr:MULTISPECIES: ATP-binding protein [unclassified Treponema]UTC68501.1 ATP-binding protein [Treponema sp. OMZ 789]UTC71211.1 ATP-binding protein [Treponema sp. OMZ 790]UTC73929.1 ATP-binding protein [Treponema sp. OMZ 791]